MVAKYVKATEIDPDGIYTNLKDFLRTHPKFADYNFDAGTLGIIMSLLQQNTYYGALYDNMTFNEAFIDSAQLRSSVVSKAKALGYVPRSAKSAKMRVTLSVTPESAPTSIKMDRGTRFQCRVNSKVYQFVSTEDVALVNNGAGTYVATNVELAEGFILTHRFVHSSGPASYVIPNLNVDTDSIRVYVQSTSTSTDRELYTMATDLSEIDGESNVYFLEEAEDGKFRVFFGDGVLGKEIQTGNMITVEYRVCAGSAANEIGTAKLVDTVGGYTQVTITVTTRSEGGDELQSTESVRFHAPKFYGMQNRVVTESDYVEHILQNFSDIDAIACWGGEKQNPPLYGKVVVSAKPVNAFRLTSQRKQDIVASLKKLTVMGIDPVMVDPTFTYIVPDISIVYDPDLTTLSAASIYSKVSQAIVDFEEANLAVFNKNFFISKFITAIDNADGSIIGSETTTTIHKRFVPIVNSSANYTFQFEQALYHPFTTNISILGSSGFYLPAYSKVFYLDDDGEGNVRAFYYSGDDKAYLTTKFGTVNYETGEIKLIDFGPSAYIGDEMKIIVKAASSNVTATRNNILLISDAKVRVYQKGFDTPRFSAVVETLGDSTTLFESGLTIR